MMLVFVLDTVEEKSLACKLSVHNTCIINVTKIARVSVHLKKMCSEKIKSDPLKVCFAKRKGIVFS